MTESFNRLSTALADRYRIERELGAGGMATVYLAEDLKHRRQVAIKVLKPELSAALGAERFLREIETTAKLRHPHILPLHDSGDAGGFLFYVMPLVEGESLRDRLVREKQLPVDDALRIAREVADALSYAHARGVIHRDIKPENILLESGHAVVADFGISRALSTPESQALTQTGTSIGTPTYMSPEQAAGEADVDGRSDLYALACVLYEMLAGQPPFVGPTVESVVRQHMIADAPPITNLRPVVPASVVAALQRALAKNPADRFNPVAQFAEAIQSNAMSAIAPVAGSGVASKTGLTVEPTVTSVTPTHPRARRKTLLVAGSAIALIVVVIAGFLVQRFGGARTDASLNSVAVLPFSDLSADKTDAHLGDGIAETLISALGNVAGLEVAARTSAFSLREQRDDYATIGQKLSVATVLEGSVQRAGDRLRITAKLINARTGRNLWVQTFDRGAADIFAVQDEVAREVVTVLRGRLQAEQSAINTSKGTRDTEAYDLYLQGRFYWNRRNEANLAKSVTLFEQAIGRDSMFALAWAGLADAWLSSAFWSDVDVPAVLQRARIATERALSIDSRLGEAHATLAYLLMNQDWNWPAADSAFRKALALSPKYSTGLKWYADLLDILERHDEALAKLEEAHRLDPLSSIVCYNLAGVLQRFGRMDESLAMFEKSLELDPQLAGSLSWTSRMYLERGDTARFFDRRARLEAVSSTAGAPVAVLRRAYVAGGMNAVYRAELTDPRLRPTLRARFHALLGEDDAAFAELRAAEASHSVWLPFLNHTIGFSDTQRRDPRFRSLLARLKIPEVTHP